jgi:hypothetical protein
MNMKPYQYYRSLGLIRRDYEGSFYCRICELGIRSPSQHFKLYHPEFFMDPSQIRELRNVKVNKIQVNQ